MCETRSLLGVGGRRQQQQLHFQFPPILRLLYYPWILLADDGWEYVRRNYFGSE